MSANRYGLPLDGDLSIEIKVDNPAIILQMDKEKLAESLGPAILFLENCVVDVHHSAGFSEPVVNIKPDSILIKFSYITEDLRGDA